MSKVTLIGAGSVLWSPKILGDFYIVPDQPVEEICLMDVNPSSLDPIKALTGLMEKKTGRKFRVTVESHLERAAQGADYVVVAISVGGLKAMEKDLAIPEKYGVFATVGDTVGPAGFSRLLRNVPVFLDMAQRVEKVAPDAWFLNVSNPLTPLVEMISRKTSLKTAGICCGIVNHLWTLQDLLGFQEYSEVDFTVAGIDHCSWFLELAVRGEDAYPRLRDMTVPELESAGRLDRSKDEWANLDSLAAGFSLFQELGYLPAISDRHLGEFFPFFLTSRETLDRYSMKRTRISDRIAWGDAARENLKLVLAGERPLKIVKTRDIVVDIVNALAGSGEVVTTINSPNAGQVANLPSGAVVETKARVGRDRIMPIETGSLPTQLTAIVLPHILRQQLALEAALAGSRDIFAAALACEPTIRDLASVRPLADELINAHRNLLPQFADRS